MWDRQPPTCLCTTSKPLIKINYLELSSRSFGEPFGNYPWREMPRTVQAGRRRQTGPTGMTGKTWLTFKVFMTEKSEKINCFYLLLCLLAFYETRSSLANVLTSPKHPSHQRIISNNSQYQPHVWKKYEIVNMSLNEESLFRWSKQNCFSPKHELRYESSTLILYKELSSSIFCCEWVSQASVTPVQISTLCSI